MRSRIPESDRHDALLALERYFIRALLMYRAYNSANHELARRAIAREAPESLASILLEKDSYFYLWVGCLKVVVEGWRNRLRCSDAAIDELLDSYMSEPFAAFRDIVFHFDPSYAYASFNYVGGAEDSDWPDRLTEAFDAFFRTTLGSESALLKLDAAAA